MKKRVFIIHGWGATPYSNWFPFVKAKLNELGFDSDALQMPNADFPVQEQWVSHMQETIGNADENTFLIGHSLGVISILRFIESLPERQKIGGAILVAGFSESLGIIAEIENFFDKPVDYDKIKAQSNNVVVINSDDDPYVPIEKSYILRDKLNAKLIILKGAGHINLGTGNFEFPEVVAELLNMSK